MPASERSPTSAGGLSEAKEQGLHEIGEAATLSGVSAKMIRHYESIGLIPPASRTDANYRVYSPEDVHTLKFIKRARSLGFSIQDIEKLLSLWQDRERASAEVKSLALGHARDLEDKIRGLQEMHQTLTRLAQACHGDQRSDCPILEKLAEPGAEPKITRPTGRFGGVRRAAGC